MVAEAYNIRAREMKCITAEKRLLMEHLLCSWLRSIQRFDNIGLHSESITGFLRSSNSDHLKGEVNTLLVPVDHTAHYASFIIRTRIKDRST